MQSDALSEPAVARLFDHATWEPLDHLISTRDLSVAFGGIYALSEISLDLCEFEVSAIVGPNGAGKTTLLNAVCGLIRQQTTGTIEFCGKAVAGWTPAAAARAGIGRSFQDPRLIESATVWENVICGLHLGIGYSLVEQLWRFGRVRQRERQARERAELAIDFVGLSDCRDLKAGSLPYGKRKLADIARAIVSGPRLLLLDEPSSGLDASERSGVEALLTEIRRSRRTTVLAVEHHMALVRATASHVLGLQAGRVVASGTPEDVLDSAEFRQAVVGARSAGAVSSSPAKKVGPLWTK
ncbi:ATP-binding cassette domain-containing protein [Jatrophihabitans cynanchi]|uniref:ATP-binding cassette domain-containing protein n=1 Tax=Jatrophihabitans cynanchi TaxID=2944128 RepID=A0ABY7K4Y9_9ACTN|nr:ATP-binding cassette domain-containing protein [Jatrophihabitans sp. SB3-54]WAX58394.1 ATP-binding cassette domain-containing protein [Jatrophihabitans sp. SB3-54]